jgi:hypothetical protein
MSTDHINTKIVVRRVGAGAAPFSWEIYGPDTPSPAYISPDRFRSMEAAYSAGQARLTEFLSAKRVRRERTPAVQVPTTENHDWQSQEDYSGGMGCPLHRCNPVDSVRAALRTTSDDTAKTQGRDTTELD